MSYIVRDSLGRSRQYRGHVVTAADNFDCELKDFDESDLTMTAVVSTSEVDRMKDVVEVSGIDTSDYFPKNPVLLPFHQYDRAPLGRAVKVWKDKTSDGIDRLLARLQFHSVTEEARNLWQLYYKSFMKGFSIGFLPIKQADLPKDEDDDEPLRRPGKHFLKTSLLEISCCPIPANQSALSEIRSYVERGDLPRCYLNGNGGGDPEDDDLNEDDLNDLFDIDDDLDPGDEAEIQEACIEILRDFELERFARAIPSGHWHGQPVTGKEQLMQTISSETWGEVEKARKAKVDADFVAEMGMTLDEAGDAIRDALRGALGKLD